MSTQVQRKLEFPVRKSARNAKKSANSDANADRLSPKTRSTRRSTRGKVTDENEPIPVLANSPRKRLSDDEDQENLLPNALSPSKKKKENKPVALRRDETPIRGALAQKLAQARIKDDSNTSIENKEPTPVKRCPLSPIKLCGNRVTAPLSPVKSPQKQLSPVKSPQKQILVASPRKQLPCSPRKAIFERSPVKKSPLKSPVMKLGKQECAAYHQVKQLFHTAKPDRLIGRDKETSEVRSFLKSHMSKKTSGSLYISGAPGTGKTAVLSHIIDELKGVHSCKTVYLNCMTLDNSSHVYGKLYTDICGKNAPTSKERLRAVERLITTDGPSIIMVLDEIDQLDSKNQEILYTIFEWPSLPKSRLILVGIANALDLTDRVLPRLQARPNCRPTLLNFAPYTKEQISAILKDRIKTLEEDGTSVIDSTAIQFCARKISAVAGDMRKALDVCRRAVELVETDVKSQRVLKLSDKGPQSPIKTSPKVPKKISVLHINNVLSDVYGSGAAAQQQETIPLQQKLIICSLLLLLKQGKMKEVTAGKLHETYCKVCKNRQMSGVDQSEFQGILTLLESRGMMGIKKAKETRMNKITLKLDEKEVEHTMQDKVLMCTILSEGLPK
ncbi:AAA ATPase [Mactra antiquata]